MIALVTDAFGGRGGIAQYNRDFLSASAAAPGMERIDILTRFAPETFSLPAKINQAKPGEKRLDYILRALAMGRSGRSDIVFCGHINLLPLAALVARLAKAKLVMQVHGIEAWGRPGKMFCRAMEQVDLVLCVSRYTRARVLSWSGIEPERVIVLPNTVSQDFTPGDASALRTQWGLDGKRVLLTVARMDANERYKGHEMVIEALKSLPQDVVYVVLGEGNDQERVKGVAREAGVQDRVHFKGAVGRDLLISAYRMADLYVMPSTGEGFGIAFLEAMASGTPALGLAVAGATDALADGELGIAVSQAQFEAALAAQLEKGKPDSHQLSAAVNNRFGKDRFITRVHSAIASVIKG